MYFNTRRQSKIEFWFNFHFTKTKYLWFPQHDISWKVLSIGTTHKKTIKPSELDSIFIFVLPIWLLMHAIPYERVFQHTWGILHNKTHNSFVLEKEKTTSVTINGYLFLFQAGFIVQLCNNSPLRSKSQRLRQVEAEEVLELDCIWHSGECGWGGTKEIDPGK